MNGFELFADFGFPILLSVNAIVSISDVMTTSSSLSFELNSFYKITFIIVLHGCYYSSLLISQCAVEASVGASYSHGGSTLYFTWQELSSWQMIGSRRCFFYSEKFACFKLQMTSRS